MAFSRKKKVAEFDLDGKQKKPNSKYGAKKVELDGHKFDSRWEATCYEFLRDDPRVTIIELQPRYLLQDKYTTKDGRKIRAIEYVADFLITVEWDVYVVDFKGMTTPVFQIKKKMFEKRYPDEILVVAKNMKELRLAIF